MQATGLAHKRIGFAKRLGHLPVVIFLQLRLVVKGINLTQSPPRKMWIMCLAFAAWCRPTSLAGRLDNPVTKHQVEGRNAATPKAAWEENAARGSTECVMAAYRQTGIRSCSITPEPVVPVLVLSAKDRNPYPALRLWQPSKRQLIQAIDLAFASFPGRGELCRPDALRMFDKAAVQIASTNCTGCDRLGGSPRAA